MSYASKIPIFTVGLVLLGCTLPLDAGCLEDNARRAATSGEHAALAKQYRLRGQDLETKAAANDATAAQLSRSMGAMRYKWPGMAPRALQEAQRNAVEARRAARESYALAENHLTLAVEAGPDGVLCATSRAPSNGGEVLRD